MKLQRTGCTGADTWTSLIHVKRMRSRFSSLPITAVILPALIVTRTSTIILDSELNHEIIDSFFSYVLKEFAGRKKYITVFGGEPLLGSPKQKELIRYFMDKSVRCRS